MSVPLFTMGFTMLWAQFLISMTDTAFCKVICIVSVVLLVFYLFASRLKRDVVSSNTVSKINATHFVLFSVIVACLAYLLKMGISYNPVVELAKEFEDDEVVVSGQIVEVLPESELGNERYVVEVESLSYSQTDSAGVASVPSELKLPFGGLKILLSSKMFDGELNDSVTFESKLYVLGEISGSGDEISEDADSSSFKNYYKSKGYYIGAYVYADVDSESFNSDTASVAARIKASVRERASDIREYTRLKLRRYLPDDYAGIMLGMLIGEKSELSDEHTEVFTESGIVHLFSVSGFHASLWSDIVYKRLLKSGLGKRMSSVVSILFLLLFMLITGFSRSTIRAGIMLIVFFVGRMCHEDSDSLNSLGLSACVILLINPFSGGDVGFLLSFFSTLGIIIGVKPIMRPIHKFLRHINDFEQREKVAGFISGIVVSLCAFVFTFPLIAIYIGDVSLVAPLTNLLTGTAASALVFLSGIGVVLSLAPLARMFCYPLFIVVGVLTKYVTATASALADLPYAYVGADADFLKVALAAVLVLCGAALILPKSRGDESLSVSLNSREKSYPGVRKQPITLSEIYPSYNYRARLTFWLSVIIILGSVLSEVLIDFLCSF